MTDTMRRYFEEKYGVADDSVAEWVQSTRGIPAERHGTPEEIGSTIAFLCSRQAGYITGDPAPSHSLSIMRNMSAHFWMPRSEEHTSELQSLMRTSYAVFCLQK